MGEINPEHAVTKAMHDQWQVIVALLLSRESNLGTVITMREIESLETLFPTGNAVVLVHEKKDGLHLKLISKDLAEQIAKDEATQPRGHS